MESTTRRGVREQKKTFSSHFSLKVTLANSTKAGECTFAG